MAQLRKAIETIDPKPDKKKEQTLLLTLLAELCEQHARRLHKEVKESLLKAGTEGHIGLPVTHTLREHTEQRAYVRDDAGKIATEVATALKQFVGANGLADIVDGMAALVSTGLTMIVGSGEGTQRETGSYKELREGDVVLMDDDAPAPALPAGFIAPGEILFSSW